MDDGLAGLTAVMNVLYSGYLPNYQSISSPLKELLHDYVPKRGKRKRNHCH